jgi:hypothetical protein
MPIKHSKSGGFSYSVDDIVRICSYSLIQTSPHFFDRQLPLHPSSAAKALLLQISRLTVNWPPFVKNLHRELLSQLQIQCKEIELKLTFSTIKLSGFYFWSVKDENSQPNITSSTFPKCKFS